MRRVAALRVARVAAARAVGDRPGGAEFIPLVVAAERIGRADRLAAGGIGAVGRGLLDIAIAGVRVAAARAVVDRRGDAEGVPALVAAERIRRADGVAAGRVVAERRRVHGVARAGLRIAAVRAELDRAIHAERVPLGGAAERIGGADAGAAGGVLAGGRAVRLEAGARRRFAAVRADVDRLGGADFIPRGVAAVRVVRADGFAACDRRAALAAMWREAVSASAAAARAVRRAAEVGEGGARFVERARVVALVGDAGRRARPVDERRREARDARARRVCHHGAVLLAVGAEEAVAERVAEDAAAVAAAAIALGVAGTHVVTQLVGEGAVREAAERGDAEAEVRRRGAVVRQEPGDAASAAAVCADERDEVCAERVAERVDIVDDAVGRAREGIQVDFHVGVLDIGGQARSTHETRLERDAGARVVRVRVGHRPVDRVEERCFGAGLCDGPVRVDHEHIDGAAVVAGTARDAAISAADIVQASAEDGTVEVGRKVFVGAAAREVPERVVDAGGRDAGADAVHGGAHVARVIDDAGEAPVLEEEGRVPGGIVGAGEDIEGAAARIGARLEHEALGAELVQARRCGCAEREFGELRGVELEAELAGGRDREHRGRDLDGARFSCGKATCGDAPRRRERDRGREPGDPVHCMKHGCIS